MQLAEIDQIHAAGGLDADLAGGGRKSERQEEKEQQAAECSGSHFCSILVQAEKRYCRTSSSPALNKQAAVPADGHRRMMV